MRGIAILLLLFAFSPAFADYIVFYENGKAGIRDDAGKIILPPSFDALGWTDGSFSIINQVTGYRQKNKWGLINLKKEFITKAEFETITSSGGDRVVASRRINPYTIKYGCVDLTGKITVPFVYDGISIIGLRAIVFNKNGLRYEHGLIDLNDKSILPVRYREIKPIGSLRFAIENFDGKTALYSEQGTQVTGFDIDSISSFRKGKAIIYQNFLQGIIDRDGNIIHKPVYREVKIQDDGDVTARKNDQWKIIDDQNKEVKNVDADDLISDKAHYLLKLSGKNGVVDQSLKELVPVSYDYLSAFDNNLAVAGKDKRYGLINLKGQTVIDLVYDSVSLEKNFVRVLTSNMGQRRWAVMDTFGVVKTEKTYDFVAPFNGKFFPVHNRGFWGAVDRYGKEILYCVYDSLMNFNHDRIVVKFKSLYGIIGFDEHWYIKPQTYPLALISDEHYLLKQDTITYLKKNDDVIYFTSNPFDWKGDHFEESSPSGTVRMVSLDGISSVIAAPPIVDDAEKVFEEHEGMRGILRNGRYGFIDHRGRLRVANRYENIGSFSGGLAPVMILGKWGYVNMEDRIIINPNYEKAGDFVSGIAFVTRNGKTGIIDHKGQVLLPLRYDSISRLEDKVIIMDNNRFGLATVKGHVLVEPRFDYLSLLPNGLLIVRNDSEWGVITSDGLPVIPMIYSFISYNPVTNQFLASQKSTWTRLSD